MGCVPPPSHGEMCGPRTMLRVVHATRSRTLIRALGASAGRGCANQSRDRKIADQAFPAWRRCTTSPGWCAESRVVPNAALIEEAARTTLRVVHATRSRTLINALDAS